MTPHIRNVTASLLVGLVLAGAPVLQAQELLASARALYTNADYEAALAALNTMRSTGLAAEDVTTVEQYRALCLMALGRAAEAEDAITTAVAAVPSFTPSGSDVSPRVRTAFIEVRRRVLPSIIQRKYAEAKTAFDRKDFVVAGDGFTEVLKVLDDPELESMTNQPPLSDLRTLARGFRDLSASASAVIPVGVPVAAPLPAPVAAAPVVAATARVYTLADANIVAPVIVRQILPPFPRKPLGPAQGVVEVVIDEKGEVEHAAIRSPIDPHYDRLALDATRNWRYRPATREGTPVKFRKLVQVLIQP